MQSFRTEIENPVVERDIIELEKKIALFKNGKIDEENFRSLRLARGVYGQRQHGVQMVRIKIPLGTLNARKLLRICDVSDEYSIGRLHITTRQDIQIHYVSLDRTPELWAELEKDEITLREACGNTVRNVTASELSGIDSEEAFDPRPYADALFRYFLRNPICQEMGRKFKISFSNSNKDTGLAYMHDMGFIATTKEVNGTEQHGFKVVMAGGLGSQSIHGQVYDEFVPVDQIIPLTEAVLRIFERFGERNRRMKARLKFLVKEWGFDKFKAEIQEELKAVASSHPIAYEETKPSLPGNYPGLVSELSNEDEFKLWKRTNVITQKDGLFAIGVKVRLGDLFTKQARAMVPWLKELSGDEITLTINQNLIIRHVEESTLRTWYHNLRTIGLGDVGFNTFGDVTACPGTDTCNLGIASSTGLTLVLENVLRDEYPEFVNDPALNIKISGCMNACGQHMISSIGFQGMSMKSADKKMMPAAQILIGGGTLGNGEGRFADKIIKVPSKRAPQGLRIILDDYKQGKKEGQAFLDYYDQQGEKYFYDLLKGLSDISTIEASDFVDWGHDADYIKAIGIGECAGVVIDLIATLFFETEEKISHATRTLEAGEISDSIYHSYQSIVNTAKALFLSKEIKTNTQFSIINGFQEHFIDTGLITVKEDFTDMVLKMKKEKASETLAKSYLEDAIRFYEQADQFRAKEVAQ